MARVPYVSRPYVRPQYDYGPTVRIADLMSRQGTNRANAELVQGQLSAQNWTRIADIANQTIGNVLQYAGDAPKRELQQLQVQEAKREARANQQQRDILPFALKDNGEGVLTYDRDILTREFTAAGLADRLPGLLQGLDVADAAALNVRQARQEAFAGLAYGVMQAGNDPQSFNLALDHAEQNNLASKSELAQLRELSKRSPQAIAELTKQVASASPRFAQLLKEKQPEPFTLNPGDVRFGPDGQPIAVNPKPEPVAPPVRPVSVPDGGRLVDPVTGEVKYTAPPKAEPRQAEEPLVAIMGPDGAPVLVPRSQAVGKRPASSREQGRAVTSGNAGEIADFDSSLAMLHDLAPQLARPGATGILAQAAAATPYITQLTGWGAGAKAQQAAINQVKQVIGKALEGGVLRKEDEIKYEKILPVIGDEPSVAAAKIDGLVKLIIQKRQNKLDSLEDAGYDVSKFRARAEGESSAPKPAQSSDPLSVTAPDGVTYRFKSKADADGFRKRAGIK